MKDIPDIDDLLSTVREFLQRAASELPARLKFDAQVATYLIDIARREIEAGINVAREGDAAALCAEIRSGRRDAEWESTLEELLKDTMTRVRIVRPTHLAREHAEMSR